MSSVTTTMTTSQPSDNDAAVETSASQEEGSRSRSWRRYRRHIVWDATVWVLFLFIPLVQLLLGSFAQWERLLGIAGVMGFIVAYVWAFSIQDPQAVRAGDPLPDLPIRALLGKLAGPILFSMMALPALGWWTAYFFPFFCSLVLFFTTLRRGLPTIITAVTLLTAASLAWNTHPESRWLVLGAALSGLTIVIARIAVELRFHREEAEDAVGLADDFIDAPAPPCPNGGADVVDGGDARLFEFFFDVEVEVGRVDADEYVRPRGAHFFNQAFADGEDFGQAFNDFGKPAHGEFFLFVEAFETERGHARAADAGETGVRTAGADGFHQVRTEQVARGFARAQGDEGGGFVHVFGGCVFV